LTVSAAVALAVLVGLGVWQLHRLSWKLDLIARIEALRTAPARPFGEVLSLSAKGVDVEYRRVSAQCLPNAVEPRSAYRYALRDAQVGWRLLTPCRIQIPPFDGLLLDRGEVTRFTGAMAPRAASFAPPAHVVGVLRAPGGKPWLGPAETAAAGGLRVYRVVDLSALRTIAAESGMRHPAPYILAVEQESPPLEGVVPEPLPQDIPNNHLVYALTWFALAAVLAWVYGVMLMRRLRGR
jgi:surfeit locus 1 family protein